MFYCEFREIRQSTYFKGLLRTAVVSSGTDRQVNEISVIL